MTKYQVLQGRVLYGQDGGVLGMPGAIVSDSDANWPADVAIGRDVIKVADEAPPVIEAEVRMPARDFRVGKPVNGEDVDD